METILWIFLGLLIAGALGIALCFSIGFIWGNIEEIIGGAIIGGIIFLFLPWSIFIGIFLGAIVGLILRLKEVF